MGNRGIDRSSRVRDRRLFELDGRRAVARVGHPAVVAGPAVARWRPHDHGDPDPNSHDDPAQAPAEAADAQPEAATAVGEEARAAADADQGGGPAGGARGHGGR